MYLETQLIRDSRGSHSIAIRTQQQGNLGRPWNASPLAALSSLRAAVAIYLCTASAFAQSSLEVIKSEENGVLTVYTTFEGGGHLQPIAPDTDGWISEAGIRFPGDWVAVMRPPATFENNPSGDVVANWQSLTGSQVIEFSEPVCEVFLHYAGRFGVTVEALDVNGDVIASIIGVGNGLGLLRWDPLSIRASYNAILAVRVLGQGLGRTCLDDFGYRRKQTVEVAIDVKPGNDNEIDPINLKSQGSLPLAVFSTPDFDATTLDVSTLALGDPNLIQIATVVWGNPQDVDGDGLLDAILHFSANELVDGGALNASTTELLLTGGTTDGQAIFGKDQVRIVAGAK